MMPAQIATELDRVVAEPFSIVDTFVLVPQEIYSHWRTVSVEAAETIRNFTVGTDR